MHFGSNSQTSNKQGGSAQLDVMCSVLLQLQGENEKGFRAKNSEEHILVCCHDPILCVGG